MLIHSIVCTCGGKVKMHKAEQEKRLIHFLIGLNEMYIIIRGKILIMTILPTMEQAFVILSQEERQVSEASKSYGSRI